jgi:hypothetical protein
VWQHIGRDDIGRRTSSCLTVRLFSAVVCAVDHRESRMQARTFGRNRRLRGVKMLNGVGGPVPYRANGQGDACRQGSHQLEHLLDVTWPSLNADKSSLKSRCIRYPSLQSVELQIKVHHSANSLVCGQALPRSILIRLHRCVTAITSNAFVHP